MPIRDASTVVLLRDGADGLEAWLLSRVVGMAFAAGMTVFPGRAGGSTRTRRCRVSGDAALAAMSMRFAAGEHGGAALIGAAVRETFEETGVLLTVPAADLSGPPSTTSRPAG